MPCTGITNEDYLKAAQAQGDYEIENAAIQGLIAAGVLAAQILIRNYISDKTDDIQDRQLQIAETFREQLRRFWDIDKSVLADACAKPVPKTDYEIARTFMDFVGSGSCQEVGLPCITVDPCTRGSTAMALAIAKVDAANFGMRYAENRQRALDEQRFSRKFKSLQSVRGIYSGVDRLIDHAGATSGYAQLGSMITAGLMLAGAASVAKPIMPTYQGRREYKWDGDSNVAASREPFQVNTIKQETRSFPVIDNTANGVPYDSPAPLSKETDETVYDRELRETREAGRPANMSLKNWYAQNNSNKYSTASGPRPRNY